MGPKLGLCGKDVNVTSSKPEIHDNLRRRGHQRSDVAAFRFSTPGTSTYVHFVYWNCEFLPGRIPIVCRYKDVGIPISHSYISTFHPHRYGSLPRQSSPCSSGRSRGAAASRLRAACGGAEFGPRTAQCSCKLAWAVSAREWPTPRGRTASAQNGRKV